MMGGDGIEKLFEEMELSMEGVSSKLPFQTNLSVHMTDS